MNTSLTSIEAYNKYGIQPSKLRFMIQNLFYLPAEYKDCLSLYTTVEQNTVDFLANMNDGIFKMASSKYYQVIYHNTDPTRLLRRQEHTTVKLSFRVAQPEFNIPPTVLVKEIR